MIFKMTGINELRVKIKRNTDLSAVRTVVMKNGSDMQEKMQRHAEFHGHYEGKKFVLPTGTTKRSIGLTMSDEGMTATVEPTTEYSPYLEYGTRYMDAQPFVKPAFNEQKEQFKSDMDKLIK